MKQTELFQEFPPVTKAEWLGQIETDLKGKPLADLDQQLAEGISIDPFPHLDDMKSLPEPLPGTGNEWEIGEDILAHDILEANKQALLALENGVQAPRFILDENLGDHRMDSLLEHIDLDLVSVHFYEKNKNANPLHLLHHFHHTAKAAHKNPALLNGSVNWEHADAVVLPDAVELLEYAQEKLPRFKVLTVNVLEQKDAVQELTGAIAKGEKWIEELTLHGFTPEAVNGHLQFSIAIGKNYFVEMAKIRALKILWANVLKGWGVEAAEMPPIEANFACLAQNADPHTNMIQSTTQAMSAILGGANRLTILPSDHDGHWGIGAWHSSAFSRRIARNVQHILKMESHLNRVADPAAGSYFIENLTKRLGERAWAGFQAVEADLDVRA